MQSSAILKHRLSTEWAVTHFHHHVRKEDRVPGRLRRNQAQKARLVSTKYYYKTAVVAMDRNAFKPAPTSERSKGFLVVNDEGRYWVAPAIDFVSVWSEAEKYWLEEERIQREAQELSAARQKRQGEAYAYGARRATERREGAESSIRALLGGEAAERARITTAHEVRYSEENDSFRPVVTGMVTLMLSDWERMMELINELRDEAR